MPVLRDNWFNGALGHPDKESRLISVHQTLKRILIEEYILFIALSNTLLCQPLELEHLYYFRVQ